MMSTTQKWSFKLTENKSRWMAKVGQSSSIGSVSSIVVEYGEEKVRRNDRHCRQ